MKRLVRLSDIFYHATNNENFSISNDYQNTQQEMGPGLYITNKDYILKWDNLLQHRDYIVEMEGNLNIIKEENMPTSHQMAKELINNGCTIEDVRKEKSLISGETFNRNITDIATKRLWSKMKGYDAIEPYFDEGYQLLVLNTNKLTINNIKTFDDFYDSLKSSY